MATPLGMISPNAKNIQADNGVLSPRKAGLGQKKSTRRTTTAGKENPTVVKTKVRAALTGWWDASCCIASRWAGALGAVDCTSRKAAHALGPHHNPASRYTDRIGCPTAYPTPCPAPAILAHPLNRIRRLTRRRAWRTSIARTHKRSKSYKR